MPDNQPMSLAFMAEVCDAAVQAMQSNGLANRTERLQQVRDQLRVMSEVPPANVLASRIEALAAKEDKGADVLVDEAAEYGRFDGGAKTALHSAARAARIRARELRALLKEIWEVADEAAHE